MTVIFLWAFRIFNLIFQKGYIQIKNSYVQKDLELI